MRNSKVFYRPIEAAIRWSGFARHEDEILERLRDKPALPSTTDLAPWPTLQLAAERLYDAIRNQELPTGIDGITTNEPAQIDHPHLTVRHVDLRQWMIRYYPNERPSFLFNRLERYAAHPAITLDTLHALTFERDALLLQIQQRDLEIQALRNEQATAQRRGTTLPGSAISQEAALSTRSETTYLNIVGGLVNLMLGKSPSGQRYSTFDTQEAIITALVATHGERLGITIRTLHGKFAAARRTLMRQ